MRPALLFLLLPLLLWACLPDKQDTVSATIQPTPTADTILGTALVYRSAIGIYIAAITKRDGSFPDTLYINRHTEFPDIELPGVIAGSAIHLVSPSEAEAVKGGEHFACLNIFAWFADSTAEFRIVRFKQGLGHWPDGRDDRFLYYSIGKSEFALDSLR